MACSRDCGSASEMSETYMMGGSGETCWSRPSKSQDPYHPAPVRAGAQLGAGRSITLITWLLLGQEHSWGRGRSITLNTWLLLGQEHSWGRGRSITLITWLLLGQEHSWGRGRSIIWRVLPSQCSYEVKPDQLWTLTKRCCFWVLPKGSLQPSQNRLSYFPST